jgi:hypothetical protein
VGQKIANGHGWKKHKTEFQTLGITTKQQYASHIDKVVNASTTHQKQLLKQRHAYYDQPTNTIVITDQKTKDGGTAFLPKKGFAYFKAQK